eukprot:TRINITY_DN21869_c0_g1_i1.p1 TRINITY_DN21869_c0_g1~~TRINITY_DN21869_c0_g1_i1.p1  ORF type:complete len:428 (+),score=131.26 TRINITY_DN21869_c0_g1_i1:62-1285(+)
MAPRGRAPPPPRGAALAAAAVAACCCGRGDAQVETQPAPSPCGQHGGCKPWQWIEPGLMPLSCESRGGLDMRFVLGWRPSLAELADEAAEQPVPDAQKISCTLNGTGCVPLRGLYLRMPGQTVDKQPTWKRPAAADGTPAATLYSNDGTWVVTIDGSDTVHQVSSSKHNGQFPHDVTGGLEGDIEVESADTLSVVANDTDFGEFAPLRYKTWFFCPLVDDFAALSLVGSAKALVSTSNLQMDIAAYGAGKSGAPRVPESGMDSRTTVWAPTHPKCPGQGPAVATFLIYNITMRDGNFRYKGRDPIGNGFVPTCEGRDDRAVCGFDASMVCIGSGDKQSCATCLSNGTVIDSESSRSDVRVFVTFYGTGSDGKHFLSGSSNPINFREFAVGNLYGDLKGSVTDLTSFI